MSELSYKKTNIYSCIVNNNNIFHSWYVINVVLCNAHLCQLSLIAL